MLGNKLQNFIENGSISDVLRWITNNPKMIYHSADSLMNRMSDIKIVSGPDPFHNVFQFIDALYTNKEEVSEIEFNLLEKLVGTLVHTGKNDGARYQNPDYDTSFDPNINPQRILILVLMQLYDIVNYTEINSVALRKLSSAFYQAIMDLYIPSHHPDLNIQVLTEYYPLNEMLENCHGTKWFEDRYIEKGLSSICSISENELIFKYVSDIYSNREAKIDFFIKFHTHLQCPLTYTETFHTLADRYRKFFGDMTESMMVEAIYQIDTGLIEADSGIVKETDVIPIHSEIPIDVMRCFVRDMQTLSHYYRVGGVSNPEKYTRVMYQKFGDLNRLDKEISMPFAPDNGTNSGIQILSASYESYMAAYEALHKDSVAMNEAERKIYNAYRSYKQGEEKVDSQITKAVSGLKGVLVGDVRSEIIEGKKFSAIGLLKKFLGTVAIFSFGKIKGACFLVVRYALKKNTSISERRKIIMELETEIKLIDEKIQDAQSDNNREAKYAMMRTKAELVNALHKIQYGLEADQKSLSKAKNVISGSKMKEGEM